MTGRRTRTLLVLSWLWVGLPFLYGLYELTLKLKQLFTG
ncbi:MFS transporter small subunit [Streptomyces lydicus]